MKAFEKDQQYRKFCAYGFLKNLRFYDAFLLLFFLENGISYSQIGILYAVREVVINIAEIPSGLLADTYGRKNALLLAFLAYIFSFLIFYISHDFVLLLVAIIFYGIGDAFRSGTHKGMIMDYLKLKGWENHKVEYYGHTRSWSQRGSAISALFAGFLVLYSGNYRIIYLCSVLPYLLNLINVYTYPKAINYASGSKKKQRETSIMAVIKNAYRSIKNGEVLQVINSAALHSSYLKVIKDYIQPVMLHIAILMPFLDTFDSKKKSGLIIGILYFLIFLLTSYASKNSFKVLKLGLPNISRLTLLLGLFAGAVCGLMISYEYWIFSLLIFVIIYLVENIRKPILTAELADQVPNEILTSVISAQSFYGTLITALLALAFGFLADNFGVGISLLIISSMLILLMLIVGKPSLTKTTT